MECLDLQAIVFKHGVPRQSSVAGKAVIRAAASHPASCSGRITRVTQFAARARRTRSEECNVDSTLEHSGWWAGSLMDGRLQFVSPCTEGPCHDMPERDPVSWTVEGSQDALTWTVIHSQSAYSTPVCRHARTDWFPLRLSVRPPEDVVEALASELTQKHMSEHPGNQLFDEAEQTTRMTRSTSHDSISTILFDEAEQPTRMTRSTSHDSISTIAYGCTPIRMTRFVNANDSNDQICSNSLDSVRTNDSNDQIVGMTRSDSLDSVRTNDSNDQIVGMTRSNSLDSVRTNDSNDQIVGMTRSNSLDSVRTRWNDIVGAPRTLTPSAPRTRLLLWTCRHPHGLFSCFNMTLGYAKRCLCPWRPGLVLDLYVDWSSEEMLYRGPHGEPNLWQAFFHQPASLRMNAEDLNAALSNKDYVNTFEAGFVEHQNECFSWAGVDQHHGPIPFDLAARGRDLCQKMICLKDEFKHEVEQSSQRLLGNEHRWLAVHIRRTDKAIEARANFEISDDFCMLRIANQCRHWQCDGVFLCSDDPNLKERLKDRLSAAGFAVSVYPATLSCREGLGTHFDTDLDSYKKAEDVMTEVLLMAKSCHGLLSTFSNVSAAVVYLSPHSYPYTTFWDPVSANSIWEWKRHRNNMVHLRLNPGSGSTHAEFLGTANSVAEAEELAAARPTHFKSLVWVRPDYYDTRWARMVYGIVNVASAPTFAGRGGDWRTPDEVAFGPAAHGVDSAALLLR